MAKLTYRSSSPDTWTHPRSHQDPELRRRKFGPIQPMDKPGLLARLLGLQ